MMHADISACFYANPESKWRTPPVWTTFLM